MVSMDKYNRSNAGLRNSWDMAPEFYAAKLLDDCKQYARFLKKSGLAGSQSDALEKIAHFSGFENWHALHTVAKKLIQDFDTEVHWPRPKGGREPIKNLEPAFPLMCRTKIGCPPSLEEQSNFETVSKRLAPICNANPTAILDMIARMNGSDSWELLILKKPHLHPSPLYTLSGNTRGEQCLKPSDACAELIEDLERRGAYRYHDMEDPADKDELQRYLIEVLSDRPDFLDGQLLLAETLRFDEGQEDAHKKVLDEALAQANSLVPASFKGNLSWYDQPNRVYHEILYNSMIRHARFGSMHKAIALARRELRHNESDNLGARYWLPILLCSIGRPGDADKPLKRLGTNDEHSHAGVDFVKAICHFANNRMLESAESLYRCVLYAPKIKSIITADFDSMGDDSQLRLVTPSLEMIYEQYYSAAVDGLEDQFMEWLSLPRLKLSEMALATEYRRAAAGPDRSLHRWDELVKASAKSLAQLAVGK